MLCHPSSCAMPSLPFAGVDPNSKDPYKPGVEDEAIVPTDFNLVCPQTTLRATLLTSSPGLTFLRSLLACH